MKLLNRKGTGAFVPSMFDKTAWIVLFSFIGLVILVVGTSGALILSQYGMYFVMILGGLIAIKALRWVFK